MSEPDHLAYDAPSKDNDFSQYIYLGSYQESCMPYLRNDERQLEYSRRQPVYAKYINQTVSLFFRQAVRRMKYTAKQHHVIRILLLRAAALSLDMDYLPSRPVDREKAEADLALNIKKATSPDETNPKPKHVRSMFHNEYRLT